MIGLLSLLLVASAVLAQNTTTYVVHNNCPAPVNLYIAGELQGTIPWGGSITKQLGVDAGFFYTDANGGSKNGSATKAGFFGEVRTMSIQEDAHRSHLSSVGILLHGQGC